MEAAPVKQSLKIWGATGKQPYSPKSSLTHPKPSDLRLSFPTHLALDADYFTSYLERCYTAGVVARRRID
jgi:hypothetical protein